jgi:hypothetical protein
MRFAYSVFRLACRDSRPFFAERRRTLVHRVCIIKRRGNPRGPVFRERAPERGGPTVQVGWTGTMKGRLKWLLHVAKSECLLTVWNRQGGDTGKAAASGRGTVHDSCQEPGGLGTGRFALSVIHGGTLSLRAKADSQSVDARRGGPDTGSPRCHVLLPRRTAGRSTSQRSLSTGLTSARAPPRGPTPKGMDPRVSRPGRTSSSRACRRPSADSQSVDVRRDGPDAGSPRCHVLLPRRTAGRSTSQRSLSTGLISARHPSKGAPRRRGFPRKIAGQGGQARPELAAGRQRTPSRWTSAGTDPTPGVHAVTFSYRGEQPGGAPRRGRSRPAAP